MLAVSLAVVVVAFGMYEAKRQHQPCGNASSRLQAKTRDRSTLLLITHYCTRCPLERQAGAI